MFYKPLLVLVLVCSAVFASRSSTMSQESRGQIAQIAAKYGQAQAISGVAPGQAQPALFDQLEPAAQRAFIDTFQRPDTTNADNSGWEPNMAFPGSTQRIMLMTSAGRYVYVAVVFNSDLGKEMLDGKIARWDGEHWSGLGDKLGGLPTSMTARGDDLYIVGGFETVAGKAIAGVAKWSGATQTWSAIGSGVGPRQLITSNAFPSASDITFVGGDIYICGSFNSVDGLQIKRMAKWNGSTWAAVGNDFYRDLAFQSGELTHCRAADDGNILVAGKFTHFYTNPTGTDATPARGIAMWRPADGKFTPVVGLSTAVDPNIAAILPVGNDFYIAGAFTQTASLTVNGIAKLSGATWSSLGSGVARGNIRSMAYRNGTLFVGGTFAAIGGVTSRRVAKWDGSIWIALDPTESAADEVTHVAVTDDGDFYASGDFDVLGGLTGNNIMRYSASSNRWRTLGEGLAIGYRVAEVKAMYVLPDGNVIVGGTITAAGGRAVNNLALWDPLKREWSAWGGGADGNVNTITRVGNLLYFGGDFGRIGGLVASKIGTYNLDSGEWRAIGAPNGAVYAIAPAHDGLVYVGGAFTATPGGPARMFALYNPVSGAWSKAPIELDPLTSAAYAPRVFALQADGDGVLIGGYFFTLAINGVETPALYNSLAYWNRKTNEIVRFGSGAEQQNIPLSTVRDLVTAPNGDVYVGGTFDKIGSGIAASRIARLTAAGWQSLGNGVTPTDSAVAFVSAMNVVGNCLFVGGEWAAAGGTASRRAAIWHLGRNDWEALGTGISGGDFSSGVEAIASGGSRVYFGGEFFKSGDSQAGSFAIWNLTERPVTPQPTAMPNPALTKRQLLPVVGRDAGGQDGGGGLGSCR
jgi:trimeric autotransporter adhesin